MIAVKVKLSGKGCPVSVEVRGHALFAPCGSDIVCAAVSMLTQTIAFSLEDLAGLKSPVKMEEGYLLLALPAEMEKTQQEKSYLLLETLLLGLRETAKAYPGYISIDNENA